MTKQCKNPFTFP